MNGTGIRFSSWAVAGFDALRNARDRQISTNAREQSGHTNGDGPRGGVGGGEETRLGDAARSASLSGTL
jgi:hypothetical protein